MSLEFRIIDKKDPLITGGVIDPFDGFPFHPGDRIVVCDVCKTAHRINSWQANGNHCTTLGCTGAGEVPLPITLSTTADRLSPVPIIIISAIALCMVGALLASIGALQFLPKSIVTQVGVAVTTTPEPIHPPVQNPLPIPTSKQASDTVQETTTAISVRQTSAAVSAQQTLNALGATQTAITRPTPAPPTPPSKVILEDDFSGSNLGSVWIRENNLGNNSASVGGGILRMASNSTHYAYIYNRTPMRLTDDFRVTVRYRYNPFVPVGQGCGAGIMLTSGFVPLFYSGQEPNVQESESEKVSFFIWHEVIWYDTFQYGRQKIALSTPYDGWHQVTMEYLSGRYYVYRDNSRIFVSNSNATKPRYLAFGNPQIVGGNCVWDAVEIDYVKVESPP